MLRHSGRPPSQAAAARPAERRGLGGTPRHIQSSAMPVRKRSGPTSTGPTSTSGHFSAKRPARPAGPGELRTHSHLMIQVSLELCLPYPVNKTDGDYKQPRGRGHGTLCWPEPRSGLLCAATASPAGPAAPLPAWPRVGGRVHYGVEEREEDRASPSVHSQDGWACLPRVPRDGQIKVQIWVGEKIKETPDGRWVGVNLTHHHLPCPEAT